MPRKTDIELSRQEISKATRTLLRLKKTLEYDRELNDLLPDNLARFDAALQDGTLLQLQAGVADIFGGDRGAS